MTGGTQYTSGVLPSDHPEHHIHQSMNSAGGRCHDNARCESMWARMKTELLYDRYDTKQMEVEEPKSTYLEILPQLLEQPEDLLCQWRPSSHGKTQASTMGLWRWLHSQVISLRKCVN